MSVMWGYVCLDHNPELVSELWLNHAEDILRDVFEQVRAGTYPRHPVFGGVDYEPEPVGWGTTAPIRWLDEHPNCRVALRSELDDTIPLGTKEA